MLISFPVFSKSINNGIYDVMGLQLGGEREIAARQTIFGDYEGEYL